MATLTWGKPKIETVAFVAGVMPASPTWAVFPEAKENSVKLTPTKGAKLEAIGEGGNIVDVKFQKNKFTLEVEVFLKKGATRPIVDVDGVIDTNYAVRLTPEDTTLEGFIFDKAAVSVEQSWTSKDGTLLKYTFEALTPATGALLKSYTSA